MKKRSIMFVINMPNHEEKKCMTDVKDEDVFSFTAFSTCVTTMRICDQNFAGKKLCSTLKDNATIKRKDLSIN